MAKQRIDALLVERGLADTRERARAAVLAGAVLVGDRPAVKPAQLVDADAPLRVTARPRFVGRGGEKLAHALSVFGIAVAGAVALDAGASASDFTDCLLQAGARTVYAVDVGYGQIDVRLRADPRVVVRERTNLRHLTALPEPLDIATLDLSFISLTKVLDAVRALLRPCGRVVALVKPQFEARRQEVGRGGIVRDLTCRRRGQGRVVGRRSAVGPSPASPPRPSAAPTAARGSFSLQRRESGVGRG
ncbi:MAG: TlyA family RNA methyltransferase [Dehalococcoidia bacterium]